MRIFMALVMLALAGCSDCTTSTAQSTESPRGHWKAMVVKENCGWFGSTTTHVSIVRSDQPEMPGTPGNIVHVEKDVDVRVNWATPEKLVVSMPATEEAKEPTPRFRDIDIVYR